MDIGERMSDFQQRLRQALQRGKSRQASGKSETEPGQWSEDELRRVHSQIRLELSEHIEQALRQFADQVPGFQCQPLYGDRGWGAACSRDDLRLAPGGRGRRENLYSRLEITVRAFSPYHVIDVRAKGTVANRELFERRYYEPIPEANADDFRRRIDSWILEYAELYAAYAS